MPYAFVQQAENSNSVSVNSFAAPSITETAGNTLVVVSSHGNAGINNTCADSAGNTYTKQVVLNNLGHELNMFYVQNCIGGANIVTISSPSTNIKAVWVGEYSGLLLTGGPIASIGNGQNGPGAGSDTVTSTAFTVTPVPALYLGFSMDASGSNFPTPGTGFTGRGALWVNNTGGQNAQAEDLRVTVSASIAATYNPVNGAHLFNTIGIAFAESTAVVTPNPFYHKRNIHYFI